MKIIEIIFDIAFVVLSIYMARVIAKRERTLREPVKYMVSYFRQSVNGVGYGSCGIDVRGGIKSDKLEEIVAHVRKQTGFPDAFVMGFSRYED